MSWTNFLLGFLGVVLLTYAKSQITEYWVPVEFSYFLIFLIIRSSKMTRALGMTFVLSLGLDLIFQTGQIKGLGCMSEIFMVFVVINLKRWMVPQYENLFLFIFFAIFYVANYYVSLLLSNVLGVYSQPLNFAHLIFFALFHTVVFGIILVILTKLQRGRS